MLNNCDIRDTIVRCKLFGRIGSVHSNHQQEGDKGKEQTAEIDADVNVSSKKTSGWRVILEVLMVIIHEYKPSYLIFMDNYHQDL